MPATARPSLTTRAASFTLALATLAGLVIFAYFSIFTHNPADHSKIYYEWNWTEKNGIKGVLDYWRLFWDGWLTTVGIAAIALPMSTFLGVALALARRSSILPLHHAGRIIVELARSTPLLVQIYLLYYVVGTALHLENRFIAGSLILSLFEGAYISEIVRAGIESVGQSQLESARAIGLNTTQTYRYIIFPQALRQMLPSLAGQFVSIVKDSSLLSVVALVELSRSASDVATSTFTNFECYLLVAAGYLIITLPISLWSQYLEHRLRYQT
jgi:polar amino acid transport system permease protein